MIDDGKKYHYLAVTNLSGLLKGISSNHKEDFYCLNCFNLYTTENKLKEKMKKKKNLIITEEKIKAQGKAQWK